MDAEGTGKTLAAEVLALEDDGHAVSGDALKSAPRGYPKDHPRARLLAMKSFIVGARIGPEKALDGAAPQAFADRVWDATQAVADWFDANVGPAAD